MPDKRQGQTFTDERSQAKQAAVSHKDPSAGQPKEDPMDPAQVNTLAKPRAMADAEGDAPRETADGEPDQGDRLHGTNPDLAEVSNEDTEVMVPVTGEAITEGDDDSDGDDDDTEDDDTD